MTLMMTPRKLSTLAILALAAALPLRADDHPDAARGFQADKAFQTGDIDRINTFNGNLLITIPIGPRFAVSDRLSYGLTLAYNGNVWDFVEQTQEGTTKSVVNPRNNAGFGWVLSLGRVEVPQQGNIPADGLAYEYTAPDGAEHRFFKSLHRNETEVPGYGFTRDGSYLRLRDCTILSSCVGTGGTGLSNTVRWEVDFPDGTVHGFSAPGELLAMRDPFANKVTVAVSDDSWSITDSVGPVARVIKVNFVGDSVVAKRVDSVEVPAFGTAVPAKYQFGYTSMTFDKPIADAQGTNVSINALTSVGLPDGTSYSMPEYHLDRAAGAKGPGSIKSVYLPTGGHIAWTYQAYHFPGVGKLTRWGRDESNGVQTRAVFDATGTKLGEWQYTTSSATLPLTSLTEIVNTITAPSLVPNNPGHRTEYFFSVSANENPDGTSPYEFGLPLTHREADLTGTRFLSTRTYIAGATAPIRSTYVRYERDAGTVSDPDDATSEGTKFNQRLASRRTVFADAKRFADETSSNFDDLGHYRTVQRSDNFEFPAPRTETTAFNATLAWKAGQPGGTIPVPPNAAAWILDTFAYKQQQEGKNLERQELAFEAATGFLRCERRLRYASGRNEHDVAVVYAHDGAPGRVTSEGWFGGDAQSISTAADCGGLTAPPVDCSIASSPPQYAVCHQYSAGMLNKTFVKVGSGVQNLADLDVEAKTGLPTASRDTGGRPTSFTYDVMGRLLSSTPQGDATTSMTYFLDPLPPVVDSSVAFPGGSALEHATWRFDGLGRLFRDEVQQPGGASSPVVTQYNAVGWKRFVSERGSAGQGTTYALYDPFGRPGQITTADNKKTTLFYSGISLTTRTSRVWDGKAEVPVTTKEWYDALGRLRQVQEPNGTRTRYLYDAGGRLINVANNTTGTSQTRSFTYDGRGFLIKERQPESGLVTYQYDAKGRVTQKNQPAGPATGPEQRVTLFYTYDTAGRPSTIKSTRSSLTSLTYGTSGISTGKLTLAQAFNDRLVGSVCTRFEVQQGFVYNPTHGRLETQTTTVKQGTLQVDSWSQTYQYDGAGRMTTVNYPCPSSPSSCTARAVTTNYAMGRPTSIPGYASAITYNGNGTLNALTHANGVVFTQTADASAMPRPGSLKAMLGSASLWNSEAYTYDGAGNIEQIGTKKFSYDASSRLLSASYGGLSGSNYKEYQYDRLGNLTQIGSGTGGSVTSYVTLTPDPATNRIQAASYDHAGNMVSYQGWTYSWDPLQRLAVVNTGPETWVHTYDAAGERVWSWRTSPSPRIDTYALRGPDNSVITDFTRTDSGLTWEDYAYREGQPLGARLSDGTYRHFDVDHLGSVRLESGQNDPVGTKRYRELWPYGEQATVFTSTDTEQMKFTGHERDLGNPGAGPDDIDYMHARYYRPQLGRFLGADLNTSSRALHLPPAWNRYAYTEANPIKYVDRDGRETGDFSTPPSERTPPGTLSFGQQMQAVVALPIAALALGGGLEFFTTLAEFLEPVGAGATAGGGGFVGAAGDMARRVLGDPNKMNHIFGNPDHGLGDLVEVLGSESAVVQNVAIRVAGLQNLPTNARGAFSVFISMGGQVVQVTGRVINGTTYISNFWVPPPV